VFRRFDDDFVGTHSLHGVVHSIGAPPGISFDAIKRVWMRQNQDLPRSH
jgi:hypothetical protein